MKSNRLLLVVVIGMLCMGATVTKIILFTDKPNSPPVTTDFMLFQRNSDYVNASVAQSLATWFNNPAFTGNATLSGNLVLGGNYYGNGAGLSNIATAVYLQKTNDTGSGETMIAPFTVLGNGNSMTLGPGTSLFGSVSGATNIQPTFLTVTADPLDPNTRRVVAGANITLTDGGAGSTFTIAASGTNVVITSTNGTAVVTNLLILQSNATFVVKKGGTVIFETPSTLIDSNITANSAVITDALNTLTNAVNAHGVLTNTVSGPPSFGLLQNTEMQNSTMVINGASTALGGTASSNGGALTNLNGQSLTGAVAFVQWDASAFMTNSAFNSNALAYVTPGAGNAALQGSSACPFLLYPLSSQQGGTNQIFVQWTAPPSIGNAIGTFSFNLLLATNTPSVQSNIVSMIQASANGAALGTAIIQTNISPVGTGFISTNISLGPLTISGSPIANSPVQFQLQLWNVTTGRITNAAWIESCRWTYTNSATQNGLLTGW